MVFFRRQPSSSVPLKKETPIPKETSQKDQSFLKKGESSISKDVLIGRIGRRGGYATFGLTPEEGREIIKELYGKSGTLNLQTKLKELDKQLKTSLPINEKRNLQKQKKLLENLLKGGKT